MVSGEIAYRSVSNATRFSFSFRRKSASFRSTSCREHRHFPVSPSMTNFQRSSWSRAFACLIRSSIGASIHLKSSSITASASSRLPTYCFFIISSGTMQSNSTSVTSMSRPSWRARMTTFSAETCPLRSSRESASVIFLATASRTASEKGTVSENVLRTYAMVPLRQPLMERTRSPVSIRSVSVEQRGSADPTELSNMKRAE
mmetsp:Transcript_4577/g.9640  ORF Transcript_4577/g.9640 Transcript_4577/m.9640 type:complete len:202 (+) Transcript_4577:295-900(+)